MLVSRNWLQTYFEDELPSAEEIVEVLMFHAFEIEGCERVEDDWVIDVDVLPNRSSDCLSHRGIARELATLLSRPLKIDPLREPLPTQKTTDTLVVTVDDPVQCPCYLGAVVRGITVGPSPEWLQKRLRAIGQKPINNIVDATNYIMFDLGQPLHAFDMDKLSHDENGVSHIRVRQANEKEEITVLTGETYTLSPKNLVITDDVANTPIALAGVKGGAQAEINSGTVNVVLEAANFEYVGVRKTSRELKLATDASLRFQNEPARLLPAFAMRDLIALIRTIAGGELAGVSSACTDTAEQLPIDVTLSEIHALLGVPLTIDEVERILVRFEWEFSRDDEEFAVTPPWERTDLHIKQEIIEEIGRVYGYRAIPSKLPPPLSSSPSVNKHQFYIEKVRHVLSGLGYSEVYTYTLQDRGEVELANPLAADKSFMRMDLRTGLLGALDLNANNAAYLGLDTVKIFEVGPVFRTGGEITHVGIGARAVVGKQDKADQQVLTDLATLAEDFGMKLSTEKVQDGVVEFSLDGILPNLAEPQGYMPPFSWDITKRYQPWSTYPCSLRDIAVWVPKGTIAEEVIAVIVETAPDLLVRHYQFDSFEKEDRVSYAWHLVFQSKERTLTDEDVTPIMQAVTSALNSRAGWSVR